MTENQKLREALSELMSIVSIHQKATGNNFAWAEMDFAREALALPTADHIPDAGEMVVDHLPDAGKMIETAAPVGERELPPLPSCARWEERIKTLMQQCGHPNSMSIYQAFKQFQNEFEHEMIAYARAALSAGDAVDGQSNASRWVASADRYPPEGEIVFFMDLATNIVGFDMWAGEGFMWMPSHWMPIPPAPAMRKGQL